ncbi:hypothetical protein [Thiorhodovibrio frisius]|uniref:Uncharacterized protein n=1 Tax=Thiorhodovibrio frisius TaxID=631362 RepID=H8Z484_9GAMM|nr:hypothetical protein [Thiorhodovibrio frisius]EIC20141.1 hypothetical protein Thi970DRAFT_03761 [Thiorhodovibrio frisius]WPL20878.1 hypothetical protein Thiofri_00984 [Thiorhodovibrio frisius]
MDSDTPILSEKDPLRLWHRAFGIALMDVFAEAPWAVELELEMALKSQLLDVAIIEAAGQGEPRQSEPELPDGLENLRAHNLLTYKSHHEALTAWVLDELTGHYVNYRKQQVASDGKRHPPDAFGLYAVAARYPVQLTRAHPLQSTNWDGVYDLPWGGHLMRVIVLNRIELHPRNAAWELFASEQDRICQGLAHYRARHPEPSEEGHWELLEHLYRLYRREEPEMAYTMEQFLRETHEMVIDEAVRSDPEAILKRFDPEDRLKGLDPATIEAWLAKQRRDH